MEKIGLIFPGGGSHYVGMGKSLCRKYDAAAHIFEEANDLLKIDLKKICFEGDFTQLSEMRFSQPAIFTTSMAFYQVYRMEIGIKPAVVMGHSLGEYTALTCAGGLKFEDAIRLVQKRGELLQKTGDAEKAGMMAVNKLPSGTVEEICDALSRRGKKVYVAVYNSPLQHVISGNIDDMLVLKGEFERSGGEIVLLNIGTPSHCPLMIPASEELKREVEKVQLNPLKFPVLSNVTGQPYNNSEDVPGMLAQHMFKPVLWTKSYASLSRYDVSTLMEVGPQSVLTKLTKYIAPDVRAYAMDEPMSNERLAGHLGVTLPDYARYLRKCLAVPVSVMNYNNDDSTYQEHVVKPYEALKKLCTLIKEGRVPSENTVGNALRLVTEILEHKKLPEQQRATLVDQLAKESGLERSLNW